MEDPNSKIISENKKELWNLSLRDVFYKYVRFLPLFVLSVAFALLIAFLYRFDKYRSIPRGSGHDQLNDITRGRIIGLIEGGSLQ